MRTAFGLAEQRLLLQRIGEELVLSTTLPTPANAGAQPLKEFGRLPWDAQDPALSGQSGDAPASANDADPLSRVLATQTDRLPRWLLLPAGSGLRRRVALPAAAAERLRDVLGFEIDRQTPFSAADVYYDARVLGRRGDGQIDAELVVVPRAALETALQALGAPLRATLAGVDLEGEPVLEGFADAVPEPTALGVNLLPEPLRRRQRDPRALWNLVLATIAVIAAGAGLAQVLDNRRTAAEAYEAEAKTNATRAKRVADQRKQLIDLVEGLAFLQRARSGRPTTVEVLDELTKRLPDNTFVEKVSIEGDRLMVIGLSPEASRLVERLEGSKLWRQMTLAGALQPEPRTGKDRFTLQGELVVVETPNDNKNGGGNARR